MTMNDSVQSVFQNDVFVNCDNEWWCMIPCLQEMDEIKSYPVEVLPGFLYIGNWRQGNAAYIQKDLKIKAHVNVCIEAETL